MDIDYLKKSFIKFWKDCYGDEDIRLYVPTDEHSSGFNEVNICECSEGQYDVASEDGFEDLITFNQFISIFPEITLDKEYAFYKKFVTWEDIYKAFKGEKTIDLIRL